jgi:hypothetical protein
MRGAEARRSNQEEEPWTELHTQVPSGAAHLGEAAKGTEASHPMPRAGNHRVGSASLTLNRYPGELPYSKSPFSPGGQVRMKTGEPALLDREVFPSEAAAFRARQQPQRRLAAHADPWRRDPTLWSPKRSC